MYVFQLDNSMYFLSKIWFIFHFHIFCRYRVAQAATFLSCLPGAAKGKWPSSPAFSHGGGWLGLEEIKNCNEQLSAAWVTWIMLDGKLYSYCSTCAADSCSEEERNPFFQVYALPSQGGLPGLFCSLWCTHSLMFFMYFCASKSSGFHRMKTVRQTR